MANDAAGMAPPGPQWPIAKPVLTTFLLIVGCLCSLQVQASQRIALVIGNDRYASMPSLQNARNDATDMAAILKNDLNFTLVGDGPQLDRSREQILDLIETFTSRLQPDDIALFYFAGHGVAEGNVNWLVPVNDNGIRYREDVTERAISQRSILDRLRSRGNNGINVVILDACRNNPLPSRMGGRDAGSRGLLRAAAPAGTFIAYAADEGQVASDRGGRNGLFTGELLKRIRTPGLRIDDLFREVGNAVFTASNQVQSPAIEDKLRFGTFYFKPSGTGQSQAPTTAVFDSTAAEIAYWETVDSGNTDSLLGYLGRFPQGRYAAEAKKRLALLTRPATRPPSPPPPALSSAPIAPASAEEESAYIAAFDMLKSGKYDSAISAFRALVERWPQGSYAANSLYWMGESQYIKRDYAAALLSFRAITDNYRASPKRPSAALKIGLALIALEREEDGRAALRQLIQDYPASNEAKLAQQKLTSLSRF